MLKYNIEGGSEKCENLYAEIVTGGDYTKAEMEAKPWLKRFNKYNITLPCKVEYCYDFGYLLTFFNSKIMREELKAPNGDDWKICNGKVAEEILAHDRRKNAADKLIPLLDSGIKVWLYHGDLDLRCNWVGGEYVANELDWTGKKEFGKSKFESTGYGLMRRWENLTFVIVADAGHMVPMDQPENAYKMLMEF